MVTLQQVSEQLLRYFDGDAERVKALAKDCEAIGFPIKENLEAIAKHPEQFQLLISFSDLGILGKMSDSLRVLKSK